jgi:hypothetical protein
LASSISSSAFSRIIRRLSLERLIAEHGADTGLPALRGTLAGDCPHATSTAMHDRCAIHYPQLPALFIQQSVPKG